MFSFGKEGLVFCYINKKQERGVLKQQLYITNYTLFWERALWNSPRPKFKGERSSCSLFNANKVFAQFPLVKCLFDSESKHQLLGASILLISILGIFLFVYKCVEMASLGSILSPLWPLPGEEMWNYGYPYFHFEEIMEPIKNIVDVVRVFC